MNTLAPLLLLAALTSTAHADLQVNAQQPATGGNTLGVGVLLGDPSAISFKGLLTGNHALQVHAGWRLGPADGGRITAAVDYIHQFVLVDPGTNGQLSPSIGIGGKLSAGDGATILGPRVPLGLSWFFEGAPVELGLELAPGVAVLPEPGLMVDGGLLARYYF